MGKKIGLMSLVCCWATTSAWAGTYANITIDGIFADWVDVPLVATDPVDNPTGVDFADFKVANDDNYVYVHMTLHAAADPFAGGTDHYFIDGDGMLATGFQVFGGSLGSEILLQGPAAYQEANGGFNEGTLAPGTVIQSPFGVSATEFEFRIDRQVVGVTAPFLGLSLMPSNNIEFLFWQNNGTQDTVQFSYTMASEPPCPGPPTTFRTITIDGDFADWTNIPAVVVDGTDASAVDFDVIRVANDANKLYVYMRFFGLTDPWTSTTNYFFDGDNNIATGFPTFSVGSEFLIQGANGFQEANGGFNEGTLAPGTVLQSPFGTVSTEFEFSVDRNVLGVAAPFNGVPLITSNTIRMSFQGDNGNDVVEFDYTFFDSVCPGAVAPAGVDGEGRPLGDLNGDCVVDLADFKMFQQNFTGP